MADPRGFLKIRERELPVSRPVAVRIRDFDEVHGLMEPAAVEAQASRCMDCGVPFCHFSCPLGNIIPEWNDLTYRGDWHGASERLHSTNNFPEITGRLCPAPCESGCVLSINQPAVTIRNIEEHIAERAFHEGWIDPIVPDRLTGNTVAVIGSGPAGLAAAQQLTRAGHTVAVFERADEVGGLLRYGIPEFKMEKSVVDRRVDQMTAEGTRFHTSVAVGEDVTGDDLMERFDAVVLAIGASKARDLPVQGRELGGVYQAVDYLTRSTKHVHAVVPEDPEHPWISAEGKDVVVIGGGDTGSDCVGTAIRQGATSVTSLEIMPQLPEERPESHPWPTYPRLFKVSSSHEEGGDTLYSTSTVEFVGDADGNVAELRITDMRFADGRLQAVEGSERTIPAQLVFLAMGFTGVETPGIVEQLGCDVDQRGRLVRGDDWQTTRPGVFAAGDSGRGQSLIVWAIAEGRSAAAAVDRYLQGSTELPAPIGPEDVSFMP